MAFEDNEGLVHLEGKIVVVKRSRSGESWV